MKQVWIIEDWAGNRCCNEDYASFDDAHEGICLLIDRLYGHLPEDEQEECFGEYYAVLKNEYT